MIAKIKIIFMLFLTAVALTSGLALNVAASSSSQDEEARKRLRAKLIRYEAAYDKYEAELTGEQKKICQAKIDVTSARLEGRDEKELLGLYKQLQDLIIEEAHRMNKTVRVGISNTTLWRVFNIEKPLLGTCFYIARLCRDSERMTMQEKIREIKAQADISNDSRISQMAIELLTENERYEDAMDYCREQISNIEQGKKKGRISAYQYELIKTRLFYQKSLYRQAMQDQGIDWDQVINIGPHLVEIELTQWRIAKKDAEEYTRENPKYAQRCLSLFSSNNPYLGSIANLKEIKEFYESTLRKISENSAQAETVSAAALPAINDKDKAKIDGANPKTWEAAIDNAQGHIREISAALITVAKDETRSNDDRRKAIFLLGRIENKESLNFFVENMALYLQMEIVKGDDDTLKETPCAYALRSARSWKVAQAVFASLEVTKSKRERAHFAGVLGATLGKNLALAAIEEQLHRTPRPITAQRRENLEAIREYLLE
jgi:hypothetical protein